MCIWNNGWGVSILFNIIPELQNYQINVHILHNILLCIVQAEHPIQTPDHINIYIYMYLYSTPFTVPINFDNIIVVVTTDDVFIEILKLMLYYIFSRAILRDLRLVVDRFFFSFKICLFHFKTIANTISLSRLKIYTNRTIKPTTNVYLCENGFGCCF